LRIGVDPRELEDGIDPAVAASVRHAIEVLRSCGAEIVDVAMPDGLPLAKGWVVTTAIECALAHAPYFDERRDAYGPALAGLIESGRVLPGQAYANMERARERYRADLDSVLESVDLVASPTTLTPPMTWELMDSVPAEAEAVELFLKFTAPTDYSGHPTITLPTGQRTPENLPLAFQLIGRHLDEATLIRAGDAFEREVGFEHPSDD